MSPQKVKDVRACDTCPMQKLFPNNTLVPPQFPDPKKDLIRLLIGEAPGQEEEAQGKPFVGGSGRILNKLLERTGIDREGLTIINCISCRPPHNVFPTDPEAKSYISKPLAQEAIAHCKRAHVDPVLASRDWRRVDLLGDKPLRIIAGRMEGIGRLRGSPLSIPGTLNKAKGIATYHPSYLMRDQVFLPVAANDLLKSLIEPNEFYIPFPSIEDVRNFTHKRFAFDIECPQYRVLGPSAPAEMVGLSARAGFAMCVPVKGEYKNLLKRIFAAATEVIGHNSIQFDLPKLQKEGIEVNKDCKLHDTMLQQHLLFPDLPHDLEFVGSQFLSKPAWKADKDCLQVYNCRDTDVTFQCWQQIIQMLKKENLESLYWDVQVPLAKICSLMHETGFKVDGNRIKFVREKLLKELTHEETNLPEFLRGYDSPIHKRSPAPAGTLGKSGKPVKYILVDATERITPWRSGVAKQRYLYYNEKHCLGLEPILDPKSGNITTGKIALDKIFSRTKNPAVRALRRLNQLDETITTFAKEAMVKISRMYPHFNVHGTATGRLSSSDPNLQNIPPSARHIYVPSHPGWVLASFDFSGIENILTAWFAGDKERLARLQVPGFSEHKMATELFFGIPYADVIKDNGKDAPYHKAKTIVHGTDGGMGHKRIAAMEDLDLKETRRLQDIWKAAIKPTIAWQQQIGNEAGKGMLVNPFGRKRWFWTSSSYTEGVRTPAQSTGADVIFRVMIGLLFDRIGLSEQQAQRVCPVIGPLPKQAQILIQVHDELVMEFPREIKEEVISVVSKVMKQPWKELRGLSFPIGMSFSEESWADCE